MQGLLKHKLLVGIVALVVAGSAGGAYAATQSSSNPQQALLGDVAKRLNVSPSQLRSAIQGALLDRLAAAVKAGQLTQAQANRLERRIERGGPLPFGPLGGGGLLRHGRDFGPGGPPGLGEGPPGLGEGPPGLGGPRRGALSAAASYLGLSEAQLLGDLRSGKTLAQVAQAQNKSVSGLEQTLVSMARTRLDRLVSAGWITKAQEERGLARLTARIDNLVTHARVKTGAARGTAAGPRTDRAPVRWARRPRAPRAAFLSALHGSLRGFSLARAELGIPD